MASEALGVKIRYYKYQFRFIHILSRVMWAVYAHYVGLCHPIRLHTMIPSLDLYGSLGGEALSGPILGATVLMLAPEL